MKRNIFLKMRSLEDSKNLFFNSFNWKELINTEKIESSKALYRITSKAVYAKWSSPVYHSAAMDGVALKAEETFNASEESPLTIKDDQFCFINTGNSIPNNYNAVIMIEQINQVNDKTIEIISPAFPWQHIRKIGEDIVEGEMLFPSYHCLKAADIPALLTSGIFEIEVLNKPRVSIIPTGSELISCYSDKTKILQPGNVLETNSIFLSGLIKENGGESLVFDQQPDEYEKIKETLKKALNSNAHLIVLNAGASAGSKDYTFHVLNDLGKILVHGITIMPGKPTILAIIGGKPVIGSPGYPISTWVCFDQFIRPILEFMKNITSNNSETIKARPSKKIFSKLGQEEFLRVNLGRVNDKNIIIPLKRGAGTITSLTKADGLLRIPSNVEGIEKNKKVSVRLLRSFKKIKKTIIIAGSHDITLDVLKDILKKNFSQIYISSSHIGSIAGLTSLAQDNCHLTGTHLLDPIEENYNISYIKKYLPNKACKLVGLAYRQQGLMIKPGNSKKIKTLKDLVRKNVTIVNRQPGSGTRVLFDYHLKKMGINKDRIEGYKNIEYTHMAVAAQIHMGKADTGIGIMAASKALKLNFIPLTTERYDLCIPSIFFNEPNCQIILKVLKSSEFKNKVELLGGYDTSCLGEIIYEQE